MTLDVQDWLTTSSRATEGGSYEGKYKRDMRRTTVKDYGKYAWGENEVGTAWQAGLPISYK